MHFKSIQVWIKSSSARNQLTGLSNQWLVKAMSQLKRTIFRTNSYNFKPKTFKKNFNVRLKFQNRPLSWIFRTETVWNSKGFLKFKKPNFCLQMAIRLSKHSAWPTRIFWVKIEHTPEDIKPLRGWKPNTKSLLIRRPSHEDGCKSFHLRWSRKMDHFENDAMNSDVLNFEWRW